MTNTEKKVHLALLLSGLGIVLGLVSLIVGLTGNSAPATGPDAFYLAQAKENGVRKSKFEKCMASEEVTAKIKADANEAAAIGGQGTPFNVIKLADGKIISIPGAYPYEAFADILDRAARNEITPEELATFPYTAEDFRPFNPETDFYQGNPDGEITIFEWSDFECPYCSMLHPTLKKVVENYPNVNWVYRQLPLSFHAQAENSAKAALCIAEEKGNEGFWNFAEAVFADQSVLKN